MAFAVSGTGGETLPPVDTGPEVPPAFRFRGEALESVSGDARFGNRSFMHAAGSCPRKGRRLGRYRQFRLLPAHRRAIQRSARLNYGE